MQFAFCCQSTCRNSPNLIKSLHPLSYGRLVGNLSIFYRYFQRHYSQEIRDIIPVPLTCHLSNLSSINLIRSLSTLSLSLPSFFLCWGLHMPPWPFLNTSHEKRLCKQYRFFAPVEHFSALLQALQNPAPVLYAAEKRDSLRLFVLSRRGSGVLGITSPASRIQRLH